MELNLIKYFLGQGLNGVDLGDSKGKVIEIFGMPVDEGGAPKNEVLRFGNLQIALVCGHVYYIGLYFDGEDENAQFYSAEIKLTRDTTTKKIKEIMSDWKIDFKFNNQLSDMDSFTIETSTNLYITYDCKTNELVKIIYCNLN